MSRIRGKKSVAKFYIDTTKEKNPKNLIYNRAEVELGAPIMASRAHYIAVSSFLREVERVKPEVLTDLQKISKEYTETVRKRFLAADLLYNLGHLWWVLVESEAEDCTEFGISLLNWAHKYNLADVENGWYVRFPLYLNIAIAWITGCIRHGQRHEFDPPETLINRELSLVDSVGWWMPEPSDLGARPFEFVESPKTMEWSPNESWDEFDGRLESIYKKHKAAYRKAMESFFESKGYEWSPQKRADHHITWLVQWQLLEWEQPEIVNYHAEQTGKVVLESAVGHALETVAKEALLPLRPGR